MKTILMYVLAAFLAAGCKQDGPVEKAGRQVDKAVEKVGDSLKK